MTPGEFLSYFSKGAPPAAVHGGLDHSSTGPSMLAPVEIPPFNQTPSDTTPAAKAPSDATPVNPNLTQAGLDMGTIVKMFSSLNHTSPPHFAPAAQMPIPPAMGSSPNYSQQYGDELTRLRGMMAGPQAPTFADTHPYLFAFLSGIPGFAHGYGNAVLNNQRANQGKTAEELSLLSDMGGMARSQSASSDQADARRQNAEYRNAYMKNQTQIANERDQALSGKIAQENKMLKLKELFSSAGKGASGSKGGMSDLERSIHDFNILISKGKMDPTQLDAFIAANPSMAKYLEPYRASLGGVTAPTTLWQSIMNQF